jgi:hypothetical protein
MHDRRARLHRRHALGDDLAAVTGMSGWRRRVQPPLRATSSQVLPGAIGATLDGRGLAVEPVYALAATASTSTRSSGRAKAEMTNRVEAGRASPRWRARTLP